MDIRKVADLQTKELQRIAKQNNVRFKRNDKNVDFASNGGFVSFSDNRVAYYAYLLVEGGFKNREEIHSMAELANAELELYIAVARKTFPQAEFPRMGNLHAKYENHSLDAGMHEDFSTHPDLERFIVTWLSIKPWEQFGFPHETKSPTIEMRLEKTIEKLAEFTKFNAEVYQNHLKEIQENIEFYPRDTFLEGKSFKPILPKDILKKY
jgi:hypothetical protein